VASRESLEIRFSFLDNFRRALRPWREPPLFNAFALMMGLQKASNIPITLLSERI
jgi:tagatose-1,6-bisphosphate aldolase non-catalytic subunit AgaZ/GatZ